MVSFIVTGKASGGRFFNRVIMIFINNMKGILLCYLFMQTLPSEDLIFIKKVC